MALTYELLIGLRYTRAKRRNHFISFISMISMLGIALGVAALIVVLSVMNGFQTELRGRILGVVSHIQISGASGEMSGWQHVAEQSVKLVEVEVRFKQDGCSRTDNRYAAQWCAGYFPILKTKSSTSGHI